jgi:hypothetical protein
MTNTTGNIFGSISLKLFVYTCFKCASYLLFTKSLYPFLNNFNKYLYDETLHNFRKKIQITH